MQSGDYEAANEIFNSIRSYKDCYGKSLECQNKILENRYNEALSLMKNKKYSEAISAFEAMDGYKDSAEKIEACRTAIKEKAYNEAAALMGEGKYAEAIVAFEVLGDYRDSKQNIDECKQALLDIEYDDALALMQSGKYDEAIDAFKLLNGYKDSDEKIIELSTLSLGEAIGLGSSMGNNEFTENKYYVTGTIRNIFNKVSGNMLLIDEKGNVFSLYGTWSADGEIRFNLLDVKPTAGDTITVYGIIGLYNGIPQMKNGWIVDHIPQ